MGPMATEPARSRHYRGGCPARKRYGGRQGPYRFILDTGSSHTAINQTLASTLGAVPVARAPVATSVGSTLVPVVRLSDVEVESARVESLPPRCRPILPAGWAMESTAFSGKTSSRDSTTRSTTGSPA